MNDSRTSEIAIVGGGPAGAALATLLASAGRDVALFERLPEPRWRAGGVYSSPLTRRRLQDLGIADDRLESLIQPIRTMEVRTTLGAGTDLEHEPPYACGLDRVRLEAVLLDRAVEEGARVRRAAAVTRVVLGDRPGDGATLRVSLPDDGPATWRARTVVGADGPRSIVARAAGVDRVARRFRRAGLTVHHHDPAAPPGVGPAVARMTVGPGWYCGVAPVPGGRVNVGVVVGEATLRGVAGDGGPDALVRRVVDALPGEREPWRDAERTDELMVALPLAHRPARLAGPGWLLVGDAAGFIDPLSGEGITRALASAALAAGALSGAVPGVRLDAAGYDRAMRARFRGKDALSLLLQGFLAWPAAAGYALDRLDRRPALREAFGRVLSDLDPASRALDPRFLARVLAP